MAVPTIQDDLNATRGAFDRPSTPANCSEPAFRTDHPRGSQVCPVCAGSKDTALVVCWSCHRAQTRQFDGGYSPLTKKILEIVESMFRSASKRERRDQAGQLRRAQRGCQSRR
jgi:hypothetical protein